MTLNFVGDLRGLCIQDTPYYCLNLLLENNCLSILVPNWKFTCVLHFLKRSIVNLSILWLGTLFTVQLQSPTGRPIRHLHDMFFRMFDGQANAGN